MNIALVTSLAKLSGGHIVCDYQEKKKEELAKNGAEIIFGFKYYYALLF